MISIAIGTMIAIAAVTFVLRPIVSTSDIERGSQVDEGNANSP